MSADSTPLADELMAASARRERLRGATWALPTATRIVTIANQKGGVGKTTTTVNLAAALAERGARVLVIDLDPQGNASTALGVPHHDGIVGTYEVLLGEAAVADVLQPSPEASGLWCLPATINLAGAEIELVSQEKREFRLKEALAAYFATGADRGFHYIFVDTPPSLGILTINAFAVANEVLIPIQCEYYALEGLSQLLDTIERIRAHVNPQLQRKTIALTMYDQRTNLAQQVAQDVQEHFPHEVLASIIPRSVRISEAPSYGQSVMTYDPGSPGALSYAEAALEFSGRFGGQDGG